MKYYIKEARERVGLNQKELAAKLEIAPNTLQGYESGKHDPGSKKLKAISQICNVSVDFLLGNVDWVTEAERAAIEKGGSADSLRAEAVSRLTKLSPDELAQVETFAQWLVASRPTE